MRIVLFCLVIFPTARTATHTKKKVTNLTLITFQNYSKYDKPSSVLHKWSLYHLSTTVVTRSL